jgi:Glycosyltransferase 61
MGSFNVKGYFDTKTDTDRMQLEWHKMEVKASPLSVKSVDDGIVLPHKPGNGWGLGGVVDGHGGIVPESIYDNGWTRFGGDYAFNETAANYVDEEVVWFGVFFRHWGHFLMDFVGRAWFMSSEKYSNQKVVYVSGSSTIDGNYLRFLELLGVNAVDILKIERPTKFRRVIIPEPSYIEGRFYTKEYKGMFDKIVSSYVQSDKFSSLKKVYFSRAEFSKGFFSKDIGQETIDKLFRMNGWTIVFPEKLTLDEQITIWNTANDIACMNGTIPLNVAFSRKAKTEMIVLNKAARLHANLLRYQRIFDRDVVYVDVYNSALTGFSRSLGGGPFCCTISPSLTAMCRDYGLAVPIESSLRKVGNVVKFFVVWIKDGIILPIRRRLSPIKRRLSSSWRTEAVPSRQAAL